MEVTTGTGYLSPSYYSRYSVMPFSFNKLYNKYVLNTSYYLDRSTSYQVYTVLQGDSWDKIATTFYGNPSYYWILCNFNRVADPFKEPAPGITIGVPNFSEISFITH